MDDPYDPYIMNNANSPGLILVSKPLTLENWNSWKRAMLMALGRRNKLEFVDGTIPPPDPKDPLHHAWLRNNNIVASWLMNSISKEVVVSVTYSSNAAAIWKDLEDRFQQNNGPRILQLKRDLSNCLQGSRSVLQYYTKMKSI